MKKKVMSMMGIMTALFVFLMPMLGHASVT